MSSAVYLYFDQAVPVEPWLKFCEEEKIEHSSNTIGGNYFYFGGKGAVELQFGQGSHKQSLPFRPPAEASRIMVSTFWMGPAVPEVAAMARKILSRFPGRFETDPELEPLMAKSGS